MLIRIETCSMSSSEILVLPSNSSASHYSSNSNHSYITKLPKRLRLQGKQWSIGLRAYSFPFNWQNVTPANNEITLYTYGENDAVTEEKQLTLKTGRYRSPTQIVNEINRLCRREGVQEKVRLNYDNDARLISVWWGSGFDNGIKFVGDVAAMVGCKSGKIFRKKKSVTECDTCAFDFSPDMNAGYHKMYIYCSLCNDRVVGDTLAPLLCDIGIPETETSTRLQIDETISFPQYIPVINTDTDTVEINIRGGDGSPIPFRGGLVSLTVELRENSKT